MATNDWKAELKRRIADIKEKKKSENSVKEKARSYLDKQRRAAEFEQALEENNAEKQKKEPEIRQFEQKTIEPEVKPTQGKSISEERPDQKSGPDEDVLFQIDEPEEANAVSQEGHKQQEREAAIKRALQKFSKASTKADSADQDGGEEEPLLYDDRIVEDETPEISSAGTEALASIRQARNRMEMSLDEALDQELPDTEYEKKSGDFLRHAPNLALEEEEQIDEEYSGTLLDKSGRYTASLRLGATGIDLLIAAIITAGFTWITSMILSADILTVVQASWLPLTGLLTLVYSLYYVTFTSSSGQTPGKSIISLRVVSKDRQSMGIVVATSRLLINLVSFALLGIGLLMAFVNSQGATAADAILKQRVVQPDCD